MKRLRVIHTYGSVSNKIEPLSTPAQEIVGPVGPLPNIPEEPSGEVAEEPSGELPSQGSWTKSQVTAMIQWETSVAQIIELSEVNLIHIYIYIYICARSL